jgi:peptide/nickel transport system ATP-binding protein
MPESDVLVEIKDLHTYFYLTEGVVQAVDGTDLTIRRGKTLGVVGESGCGKSITSLSLLRLVPQPGKIVSGEITYYRPSSKDTASETVDVVRIDKLDPKGTEIRHIRGDQISMVFQEPMTAMSPVRTIGQQITEVIMLHQQVNKREARKRAIDMLARAKMSRPEKVIDDYPFQLSGGMRQRAVIAMALACDPKVLFADEPTTALDVVVQAQIGDLLAELTERLGLALVMVTHDIGMIAETSLRAVVMYAGVVVEDGPTRDVLTAPRHPYTHLLLEATPVVNRDRPLVSIPGTPPRLDEPVSGCAFAPRCPRAFAACAERPHLQGAGHVVACHAVAQGRPA